MKLPKVSAVVAAAVLAPAVLFPSSASAADAPRPAGASGPDNGSAGTPDAAPADAGQEDLDRAEVRRILADKASGVSVREAAEKALAAGTAAALREFLTTGLRDARHIDHRVEAFQVLAVGGPAVKKAAEAALRGSYEDLLAFLKEGQYTARAVDDRAEIERLMADLPAWSKVREQAGKALAVGTPAALRKFLVEDLQGFRHTDYRIRTAQIMDGAGPAVRKAGGAALFGTYEEIAAFVEKGQYVARAVDDRAEIERVLADPATGPGVREAAQKALDAGTPAALRHFLEAELPVQREHDARVALSQIMAKGGPAVYKAASAAMDGSYADVVKFLQETQYTARAEDNRAQVSEIAATGGAAVKKAALAALGGNDQAIATFLNEGWAKARAEDEAAAKPGSEPTARPAEQSATTPATVPAAQTGGTGGQVVQAAVTTTTGTAAVTRTTTGTTATATTGSGQLAATGTEGLGLEAGGAAAAVAAGAALVVVSRRRRAEES